MPFPVPAAALISALAADARALAGRPGCQVVLQPEDADPLWQRAVLDLRTRLSEPAVGDVDCGGIEVRADGARTSLVFTTRDGRRAERLVGAPSELLSVAEALQITIPESPPQEQEAPAALPAKATRDELPKPARPEPAPTEAATAHILIGGSGGVRLLPSTPCTQPSTTNCTFGFASLRIGVGVNVGRWEFGVLGQYDPTHVALSGSPSSGLAMSTYAVGLRVGRREPLGPVAAVAGATASIALTDQSNQTNQDVMQTGSQQQESRMLTEPRVGLFAGVVVPRRARVRVRPELAVDARIGPAMGQSSLSPLPPLPWWSTSASVGIEWEAP